MQHKRLIAGELIDADGNVCALGAVAQQCSIDVSNIDPDDADAVAKKFNIARSLAAEIAYVNDEDAPHDPEKRWKWVRQWVAENTAVGEAGEVDAARRSTG
jgi:hypothetical protein